MARSVARALAAVLVVASMLTVTTVVSAQETTKKAEVEKGYGYKFDDDLLQGIGMDGNVPKIVVRNKGLRQRLMRPRTQFVTEMLRSVEKL